MCKAFKGWFPLLGVNTVTLCCFQNIALFVWVLFVWSAQADIATSTQPVVWVWGRDYLCGWPMKYGKCSGKPVGNNYFCNFVIWLWNYTLHLLVRGSLMKYQLTNVFHCWDMRQFVAFFCTFDIISSAHQGIQKHLEYWMEMKSLLYVNKHPFSH